MIKFFTQLTMFTAGLLIASNPAHIEDELRSASQTIQAVTNTQPTTENANNKTSIDLESKLVETRNKLPPRPKAPSPGSKRTTQPHKT